MIRDAWEGWLSSLLGELRIGVRLEKAGKKSRTLSGEIKVGVAGLSTGEFWAYRRVMNDPFARKNKRKKINAQPWNIAGTSVPRNPGRIPRHLIKREEAAKAEKVTKAAEAASREKAEEEFRTAGQFRIGQRPDHDHDWSRFKAFFKNPPGGAPNGKRGAVR